MYSSAFKNYNVSDIFSYRFLVHGTLFKLDQSTKFPYLVVYKKKPKWRVTSSSVYILHYSRL